MQKEISIKQERKYIPAAGKDWRLPLYDPLCKLFGIDSDRKELIDQAALQPTHRVLDIGCGTGTLILLIKRLYPGIEIMGLDPDPKALSRAKRKTERAHYSVQFDQGFSDELPYPPASFDRVFSSYMMHHMKEKEKEATLLEAQRVLKPHGSFHMLDFEHKEGSKKNIFANSSQHLALMEKAGFTSIRKVSQKDTLFGRIAYYKASAS
jgi:ubiquinone/menaquinone biosynthesis C-methylase UbiE